MKFTRIISTFLMFAVYLGWSFGQALSSVNIGSIAEVPDFLKHNKTDYLYSVLENVYVSNSNFLCGSDQIMGFNIYSNNIYFYCAKEPKAAKPIIVPTNAKKRSYFPLSRIDLDVKNVVSGSLVTYEFLDENGEVIDQIGELLAGAKNSLIEGDLLHLFLPLSIVHPDGSHSYISDYNARKVVVKVYPLMNLQYNTDTSFLGFRTTPAKATLELVYDQTDPGYTSQYYLHYQNYPNPSLSKTNDINLDNLNETIVAVIDDGIGFSENNDLIDSSWINAKEIEGDGIDNDSNGFIDDVRGWNFIGDNRLNAPQGTHGTTVASIIAAKHNNNFGIKGIAPNAKIMSLVACNSGGCDTDNIISAINYAVTNGARVVNLSLAGNEYAYTKAFDAAIANASSKGVFVVSAAGNGTLLTSIGLNKKGVDTTINKVSPVCNDVSNEYDVFGVGGLSFLLQGAADWSNYGACVDFWAPGEGVVGSSLLGKDLTDLDGTSFSAPQVSGILALALGINSQLTPKVAFSLLKSNLKGNVIDISSFLQAVKNLPDISTHQKSLFNNDNKQDVVKALLSPTDKVLIDGVLLKFYQRLENESQTTQLNTISSIMGKIDLMLPSLKPSRVYDIVLYLKKSFGEKLSQIKE